MFKKFFFVAIFLIILSLNVFSFNYGISPGLHYVDFESGEAKSNFFEIVSRTNETRTINVSVVPDTNQRVGGFSGYVSDLGQYINLDVKSFELKPRERIKVFYTINMPEEFESGKHRATLRVEPQTKPGEGIGTKSVSLFQVFVVSPFPGKFGEIRSIRINDSLDAGQVKFSVDFWNLGLETINNAKTKIDIFDFKDKYLETIFSNQEKQITPDEIRTIEVFFNGSEYDSGNYKAKILVLYDDLQTLESLQNLQIGLKTVQINKIINEFLTAGTINNVFIEAESKWGQTIENVAADVQLIDIETGQIIVSDRTNALNFDPFEIKTLEAFFNLQNIEPKTYKLKATINVNEESSVFETNIIVSQSSPFSFDSNLILAGLFLFLLIILFTQRNKLLSVLPKPSPKKVVQPVPAEPNSFIDFEELNEKILELDKTTATLLIIKSFLKKQEKDLKKIKKKSQKTYKQLYNVTNHVSKIDELLLLVLSQKSFLEKIKIQIETGQTSQKPEKEINENESQATQKQFEKESKKHLKTKKVSNKAESQLKLVEDDILARINSLTKQHIEGKINKESFELVMKNLRKELKEVEKLKSAKNKEKSKK